MFGKLHILWNPCWSFHAVLGAVDVVIVVSLDVCKELLYRSPSLENAQLDLNFSLDSDFKSVFSIQDL